MTPYLDVLLTMASVRLLFAGFVGVAGTAMGVTVATEEAELGLERRLSIGVCGTGSCRTRLRSVSMRAIMKSDGAAVEAWLLGGGVARLFTDRSRGVATEGVTPPRLMATKHCAAKLMSGSIAQLSVVQLFLRYPALDSPSLSAHSHVAVKGGLPAAALQRRNGRFRGSWEVEWETVVDRLLESQYQVKIHFLLAIGSISLVKSEL